MPERLEYEIAELTAAGILCEIDRDALERGFAVLNLRHTVQDRELSFIVRFPDTYPYMRFEVEAPDLKLRHHQNPFRKNLCMIGRSTENWCTEDTVASYFKDRLPAVIQSGSSADPQEVKDLEELQGEPVTDYYTYFPNSVVIVDSSWSIDPEIKGGILELGIEKNLTQGLRCAVCTVKDWKDNILAKADPKLSRLYPERVEGRWVRSQKAILEDDCNKFLSQIIALDKTFSSKKWQNIKGRRISIIGVLFPEEVAWRQEKDGWIFLVIDWNSRAK